MTEPPSAATADDVVWAMLFIVLGTMIVWNRPPDSGIHLLIAGVAYVAGAVFAYRLLIRR